MSVGIDTVVASLKAAGEVAEGLAKIKDPEKFTNAIDMLRGHISLAERAVLAAQSHDAEAATAVNAPKENFVALDSWNAEKSRYRLQELPPGVFVYALKSEMADGEQRHAICQTCYQHGKKSILDGDEAEDGTGRLTCPECHTVLLIGDAKRSHGEWP
jgi:hypothetical protein